MYVHAGGSPQAHADARERRATASSSTTPTSSARAATSGASRSASPRTTCTRAASTCGSCRRLSAPRPGPIEAKWKFAPGHPARAAAAGRFDHGVLPGEHDHLPLQPEGEHLPPLGQRRRHAARRVERQADRAEERDRDARQFLAAQRRLGQEPPGGRHHRPRQGVDRHQWPNDQGHLAEEQDQRADQVLRRRWQARSR